MRRRHCIALLAIAVLVPVGPSHAMPSFSGLGDLPGGSFGSFASAISADGSTVVGVGSNATGLEPFRWTQAGGMVGIGSIAAPGDANVTAAGVSSDGRVVVGRSGNEAYRWTQDGGMVGIGGMPPSQPGEVSVISQAQAVSGDGSQLAGVNFFSGPCHPGGETMPPFCESRSEGFTWTQARGFESLGAKSPRDIASGSGAITGAGLNGGFFAEAFLRDPNGDTIFLGHVGDHLRSMGNAISADGSTVVGQSEVGTTPWQAFRWTEEDGLVGLGNLTTFPIGGSEALGVSADGSIVVGFSPTTSVGPAFIWFEGQGMRPLAQVLEELGIDLDGWFLNRAVDISDDGRTIVGWGTNPDGVGEAWIATIPEPGTALLVGAGLTGLALARRRRVETLTTTS